MLFIFQCAIIIVGNKSDLDRKVAKDSVLKFVEEDMMYIETSAKEGLNVNECF